jgi:uncharacterized membrane protein
MKSTAAIGEHPMHPMLVAIPIGAFVLALIGDIATSMTQDAFWYQWSFYCIGIGIIFALVAAIPGFVDYLSVKMSAEGKMLATWHMALNLTAVVLYVVDFWMRMGNAALNTGRWPAAMGLEILPLLILGASGWIGGQMTFVHKVGVVEDADKEATEIGRQQAA